MKYYELDFYGTCFSLMGLLFMLIFGIIYTSYPPKLLWAILFWVSFAAAVVGLLLFSVSRAKYFGIIDDITVENKIEFQKEVLVDERNERDLMKDAYKKVVESVEEYVV